jgi:hypothetical protein
MVMRTTHRSYNEELGDFRRLARFITGNNQDIRTYSTWCIGRFAGWKYAIYNSHRPFCGLEICHLQL